MFILKTIFKILAFFFLVALSMIVEVAAHYWSDSTIYIFVRVLVHTFVVLLAFFLIKQLLLKRYSLKKAFASYLIFCILFLFVLNILNYYSDKRLGIKQFNYPVVSCFEIGRGLFSHSYASKLYDEVTHILPYYVRYYLISAGDGCRVFKMKGVLYNEKGRAAICPGLSKVQCLKEIVGEIKQNSAYTVTGKVLTIAIGAMISFETMEEYKIKNHPLVTDEIRERGRILGALNSIIVLQDMLNFFDRMIVVEESFSKLFPDFPNEEISKITPETKNKLLKMVSEDAKRSLSMELYKTGSGLQSKYTRVDKELSGSVLNAFLVRAVDREINGKLDRVSCFKRSKMFETSSQKMLSGEYKKYLTEYELKEFKERFKKTFDEFESCKKIRDEDLNGKG